MPSHPMRGAAGAVSRHPTSARIVGAGQIICADLTHASDAWPV